MLRMLLRFVLLTAVAVAATWLAYRPGNLTLEWLGYHIELPLAVAAVLAVLTLIVLAILWSLLRRLLHTPGAVTDYFRFRRTRRGEEALSAGMIAVSAGDIAAARRQAQIAVRILPEAPLARLLQAEAASLDGDTHRVKDIYEEMLADPVTELVALRGLFEAARRGGDAAAARRYAEQALRRNAGIAWASNAMLAIQSAESDWPAVSATIEAQRKARLLDDETARKKRAVVLTAQALAAEDTEPDAALDLATRAHKLDPALVPAAVVAGRINAQDGSLRRAARILEKTWSLSPHPDIAAVYAHARSGDSPLDRLKRVRDLIRVAPGGEEGAVALAEAAIDARDWTQARQVLADYVAERPRARICALMAEIEDGEFGDKGRAREWLARAVRAPRDPVWFAHGMTSRTWLPVSRVNGELGAFQWTSPPEALTGPDEAAQEEAVPIEPPTPAETEEKAKAPDLIEARPVASDNDAPRAEAPATQTSVSEPEVEAPPPAEHKVHAGVTEPVPPPTAASAPPAAEEVPSREAIVPDKAVAGDDVGAPTIIGRQPDDPGPEPQSEARPKTGWLGRGGG